MIETIKVNIINPLVTRVGTLAGGALAQYGLTDADTLGNQIAAGVGAVMLVALEALLRRMWAKR